MPEREVLGEALFLQAGVEYFNIFSLEPAPLGPGTGPYAGLHTTNPTLFVMQLQLPLGALPFHFIAAAPNLVMGPYPVTTGVTIEGLSFALSLGSPECVSSVANFTVQ
jgi:hypothetical protein